eukprot:jgi/Ulvmu1/11083/UM007_0265.1
MTRLVGLTGGIACGKSLVASNLSDFPLIDCDRVAQECTRKGSWGWRRVKFAFKEYDIFEPDGSINRTKLGDLVYGDPQLRRRLNEATHLPIQIQISLRILVRWVLCTPTVVVDMPLLFETKSQWLFSDILVVTCTPEQQLERLCQRDGLSHDAAQARVAAQLDMSYKAAHSTVLIDNSGSTDDTVAQVRKAAMQLRSRQSFWKAFLVRVAVLGGAVAAGLAILL